MKPRYSKKRYSRKNKQRKSKKLSKQRGGRLLGIGKRSKSQEEKYLAKKEAKEEAKEKAKEAGKRLLQKRYDNIKNQMIEQNPRLRNVNLGNSNNSYKAVELLKQKQYCLNAVKAKDAKYRKQLTDLLTSGYYDRVFVRDVMDLMKGKPNIISEDAIKKAERESSDCQGRGYLSRGFRRLGRGFERGLKLGYGKSKLNSLRPNQYESDTAPDPYENPDPRRYNPGRSTI